MAVESPVAQSSATDTYPYALLRAGYPYYTTLGMRRVTTSCMDMVVGDDRRLFVLCRDDGQGGLIRKTNWDDEDLGTIGKAGTDDGEFMWPVQMIRDGGENLYVSDEGLNRISAFTREGELIGVWGTAGSRRPVEPTVGPCVRRRREPVRRRYDEQPRPEVHQGRAVPLVVWRAGQWPRPIQYAVGESPSTSLATSTSATGETSGRSSPLMAHSSWPSASTAAATTS